MMKENIHKMHGDIFHCRNPTPSPVSNPLGGVTTWSEFTMNDMNVLYLGAEGISNEKEYRQKEYSFWNQYLIGIAGEELGKTYFKLYLSCECTCTKDI